MAEEVAGSWLAELLGLQSSASVGFTSGATMANVTALTTRGYVVLKQAGWNVDAEGFAGGPPLTVIGEETHDRPVGLARAERPIAKGVQSQAPHGRCGVNLTPSPHCS